MPSLNTVSVLLFLLKYLLLFLRIYSGTGIFGILESIDNFKLDYSNGF